MRGFCSICGKSISIIKSGVIRSHGGGWLMTCEGSGKPPKEITTS
jgi:hypothetical protein